MKAKAHLELNPGSVVKDNKKGFFRYVGSRKKIRRNVDLQLNEVDALVMEGAEKVKLLNAFFASVFTDKTASWESQSLEVRESLEKKEDFPMVEEDLVRNQLGKFCTQIHGY